MTSDPLQCTYEDARRTHLRQGMALSTRAKVDFFEEMVVFAFRFGARDRRVRPQDASANSDRTRGGGS